MLSAGTLIFFNGLSPRVHVWFTGSASFIRMAVHCYLSAGTLIFLMARLNLAIYIILYGIRYMCALLYQDGYTAILSAGTLNLFSYVEPCIISCILESNAILLGTRRMQQALWQLHGCI